MKNNPPLLVSKASEKGFLSMINRLFQQGTRFLQRWSALITPWPTWQCLPLWSFCLKLSNLMWLSMVQVWAQLTEMDFSPKLCLKWGGSSFGNCGLRHHLSRAFHPLALRRKRFNWDTEVWPQPTRRWWRQVWLRPDRGTRAESYLAWRYWELEIKREEWNGYRDKMVWIRCPLQREGKIKLRFSE